MTKARDLADGVINTSELADGSITTAKIADGDITTAKIADTAITAAKLNVTGNGTAGQVLKSDGDGSFTWIDTADPFTPTTVSGTTPSLDLGSYNFFSQGTLTGDTTVSFANTPTSKRFAYDFTGAGVYTDYDFLNNSGGTSYNPSGTYNSDGTRGHYSYLADNGTKMYSLVHYSSGGADNNITQHNLSTAYNASTSSQANIKAIDVTSSFRSKGIWVKSDGTKLFYVWGNNDGDYLYFRSGTMSTAYDLSTYSQTSSYTYLSGDSTQGYYWGLFFKPDGTSFYMCYQNTIKQFNMSTAWDMSSSSVSLSYTTTGTFGTTLYGITFNDDGTVMALNDNGTIRTYNLSTAYDARTAGSEVGNVGGGGSWGLVSSPNGKYLITNSNTSYTIESMSIFNPYTITYPASVQNSDYVLSIEDTDRYLYEFVTTDGGTNVWLVGRTKYDNN